MTNSILTTIGQSERIDLIDLSVQGVPAKVDTGADSSAIWASRVKETESGLKIVFFGPGSPYYSGKPVTIDKDYKVTRVANSFGHKEMRYKLKLKVRVNNRVVRTSFTLADRSQKRYPVLLGKSLLNGKFVVDVSQKRGA